MKHVVSAALASAFLAGQWTRKEMSARAIEALGLRGRQPSWLGKVLAAVLKRWPDAPLNDSRAVADFISHVPPFDTAWLRGEIPRQVAHWLPFEPRMGDARWPVPVLHTVGDVSTWLGLSPEELRWFSDTSGVDRTRRRERARNYVHQWVPRGEKLPRLLEAPKARLKAVQRKVLRELLEKLPVHDAAHGFVAGRSALTHARLHVGKAMVVRFDLRHFFTSIDTGRAFGVLRQLGYSFEIASVLLGVCTTRTPPSVLSRAPVPELAEGEVLNERFALLRKLEAWHFPQGAPTSPAWANLCVWWVDARLTAFAKAHGLTYSRYADDLVFSGDRVPVSLLSSMVNEVVADEGFVINRAKTRVMRAHERQVVTGVVVNEKTNFSRADFDALKALLHRCEVKGALSQSKGPVAEFRAELEGRVAWVSQLNATRGAKLKAQLARISWAE